jgi:NADH-quinone oxidoreductase subunit L
MSPSLLAIGVVFSTLIGFSLSLCLLRYPRIVQIITCFAVAIAFISTLGLWITLKPNLNFTIELFGWLKAGKLRVKWGISFDNLNFIMAMVVTFVSFWVHIYSLGYMAQDPNRARYMAYLNFFTFTMLLLVTSPTIAQLFVGWEGVGLASYLLIGFWNQKPRASAAAMKAFIVNRIGDAGMLLGICVLFYQFETFDFSIINLKVPSQIGETINFWGLMSLL